MNTCWVVLTPQFLLCIRRRGLDARERGWGRWCGRGWGRGRGRGWGLKVIISYRIINDMGCPRIINRVRNVVLGISGVRPE